MHERLDGEEIEILGRFERGVFESAPNVEQEIQWAQ